MKNYCTDQPNGYLETIQKGIAALRPRDLRLSYGLGTREERIEKLKKELETAEAVVIGAGAGLSTSAGFVYDGERFDKYLSDFGEKCGFSDMYSGAFYVERLAPEAVWAFMSRVIWINRYMDPPKQTYSELLGLVKDKDYFVITTNVDHCFQKAGVEKERLFYTQGDYGLWQCSEPCHEGTYDNEDAVRQMLLAQGFTMMESNDLELPKNENGEPDLRRTSMHIPSELLPRCPVCGRPMSMNLRGDDTFVEDEGWHKASATYADFLRRHENGHTLFLEVGVGANTPVIIKYPFWAMTRENKQAVYACLNYDEAVCPVDIEQRSICIDGDAGEVIQRLRG